MLSLSALSLVFDALSAVIVLIPIFLLLHIFYVKNLKRSALYFVFAFYLSGVFSVVGIPDITNLTVDFDVNIIPFVDMISDFKNAVLNVILFVPLGFMLPFIWKKFREFKYTLIFGFGMTAAIEILQIFAFRLSDINDLITNTVGTVVGFFAAHIIVGNSDRFSPTDKTKDVFIISAVALVTVFAAVPFISSLFWSHLYY